MPIPWNLLPYVDLNMDYLEASNTLSSTPPPCLGFIAHDHHTDTLSTMACANPMTSRALTALNLYETQTLSMRPLRQTSVKTWVRTITSSAPRQLPAATFGRANDAALNNTRQPKPRTTRVPDYRPSDFKPPRKPVSEPTIPQGQPPSADFHIDSFVDRSKAPPVDVEAEATSPHQPPRPRADPKTPPKRKWVDRRESWAIQKSALTEKFPGGWQPRKKLSPETMQGLRDLHEGNPQQYTTEILAGMFKVSPEAVRRILKSKWRPTDEEQEDRLRRWDKRGEQIWTNLVELGVKPPKKWREMGVGRAESGQKPSWKSKSRNQVRVHDSTSEAFGWQEEDLIPIVDGKSSTSSSRRSNLPFSDRIGV